MFEQNFEVWTKEEIIERIRARAESYAPEWRFDTEHPDIGSALALVYAELFVRTAEKFSRVFQKNRIEFLNELDARLMPAVPAAGYVTFSLVNGEVAGTQLRAGTMVSAPSEDEEIGRINYRTLDDIYVSPVRLGEVCHVCDQADYLARVCEAGAVWTETALFDYGRPNLQQHQLYISHQEAFPLTKNGRISLACYLRGELPVPEELLTQLTEPGKAYFEYYSADGYQQFARLESAPGTIYLYKEAQQPAFARTVVDGSEGYFIRCVVADMEPFEQLGFNRLLLGGSGSDICPDSICADGVERNKKQCFPFGERLAGFSEVYFGSREVMGKRGALVTLAFHLHFARIPMDYNPENDPVKWDWIMKRSDLKADPEYDVTIAEVLWEYYNGTGWARLFPDDRYSSVFLPGEDMEVTYKKITFRCPADLEPLAVNSCESCYIRARILKLNNQFKLKGAYLSPVIADSVLDYDYAGFEVAPEQLIAYNNLEYQRFGGHPAAVVPGAASAAVPVTWRPFIRTGTAHQAICLGLTAAPKQGPVTMFFMVRDGCDCGFGNLSWEYLSRSGWKDLNVIDETGCFSKSGLVTFMGRDDFVRARLFGCEQYWLRFTAPEQRRGSGSKGPAGPVIQGIYMNTARVINVDQAETEWFRMEVYQEDSCFELAQRRIIQAEVLVNELGAAGAAELAELLAADVLEPVCDEAGVLKEAWVKWRQVEDFSASGEDSRDYVLDQNAGLLMFGNGRAGRIPPSSGVANIRVNYQIGGGEHTNVAAGRIRQMNQEIGFINDIRNPQALTGGCGIEPLDEALVRNSARLRHQNRAVTARDYEDIAMAASRLVRRVSCFAGYDAQGRRSPGAVTLVVLQKDFSCGRAQFSAIRDEVQAYLQDKVDGNLLTGGKLAVIEPDFVEFSVRAEITAAHYNAVFQVKKQVDDRLNRFLNPLTGNFHNQGWEIGRIPNHIQIRNAIGKIPGLVAIGNLYITLFVDDGRGRSEVAAEQISRNRYILPLGGRHEVLVEVR